MGLFVVKNRTPQIKLPSFFLLPPFFRFRPQTCTARRLPSSSTRRAECCCRNRTRADVARLLSPRKNTPRSMAIAETALRGRLPPSLRPPAAAAARRNVTIVHNLPPGSFLTFYHHRCDPFVHLRPLSSRSHHRLGPWSLSLSLSLSLPLFPFWSLYRTT